MGGGGTGMGVPSECLSWGGGSVGAAPSSPSAEDDRFVVQCP